MFKKFFLFVVCLAAVGLLPLVAGQAVDVPAPTLVSIQSGSNDNERIITGLTKVNTDVFIFLDGLFVGSASVKNEAGTENSSFTYRLRQKTSLEKRVVTALARDSKTMIVSGYSAPMAITKTSEAINSQADELPAPTLIYPNETSVIGKSKPTITGLTVGGSNVEIYIDGAYVGDTGTTTSDLTTTSFSFVSTIDLAVGQHQIRAVAKNEKGQRSLASEQLTFNIEDKLPAPTLEEPIASQDNLDKPLLAGLVYGKSSVFVYVDDKLIGQAKVDNRNNEVASFAYQVQQPLTKGGHLIYTVAIDQRGKESDHSNYVYFFAGERQSLPVTDETATKTDTSLQNDDINSIINQKEPVEKDNGGMIDESKERQSSLKWNIVVFLAFLLAVIAWIFWVNRELIKEKRKHNQSQTESEATKDDKQDKLI